MSAVITPFEGTELFNTASFNNRISQINTGFSCVSNPNLLDNWYFGNPVDQRKGYIQIAGTMMYKDAACTDQFGPSSGTTPVVVYATYARPIDKGVELALYIPLNNIVRGYTDSGYTVDRWHLYTDGGNVSIPNGYLDIYSTKQYGTYLSQKITPELASALAGKTVTFSVLAADSDAVFSVNINKDGAYIDGFTITPNTVSCKTWTFPSSTNVVFDFAGNAAGHVRPIAAKLEIGPTQTLAHREGDRWVMNEVPEYGEQLRRGQWYFWRFSPPQYVAGAIAFGIDANTARAIIYLPEQMRTSPTLNLNASSGFFLTGASGDIFDVTVSSVWTNQNSVYVDFKKSGAFEVNAPYFVRGGASSNIDISADL